MTAAHPRLIAVPDHLWADFLEAVAKAGIALHETGADTDLFRAGAE